MDTDDIPLRRRSDDPLEQAIRYDLDRLSVAELEQRVAMLDAETERTKTKLCQAVNHKASADALFRKS